MDPTTQYAINSSSSLNPTILQLLRLSQFSSAPNSAQTDLQQTANATDQSSVAPPQQQQQNAPQQQQQSNPSGAEDYDQSDQQNYQQPSPMGASASPVTGFANGFLSNFQPQTEARTQLTNLMQNMPQYQEPGFFAKLEAGLIGATRGPQAAEQYLESPYNRQMNQWKNQAAVAQQAASDENYSNNLSRQLATIGAQE